VRDNCKFGRSDGVHLALYMHQSTRENEQDRFDTVVCSATSILAAACAVLVNQTERSYRTKRSNVKRNVKRFHANVCHRFRCHPMILSSSDVTGQNT
jgi:hypothetical protein